MHAETMIAVRDVELSSHWYQKLGAPLARAEAGIAFSTLLRRLLKPAGAYDHVDRKPTLTLLGITALPVSLT